MSYEAMRIQQEIDRLTEIKRELRRKAKSLQAREQYLSEPSQFKFSGAKALREQLAANLNETMMPVNIGGIDEVAWPFKFQASVDFGQDPQIARTIRQDTFFQVDEEACFLMMGISREHNTDVDGLSATWKAPYLVEIIDRQSSRRFNSGPIPLQAIGENSLLSVWPTPMMVMPTAIIDISVYGLPTTAQQLEGNGEIQFSFFGYRTRIGDAQKIMDLIFKS